MDPYQELRPLPDDRVAAVWSLRIVDGAVHEVHGVVDPDKLGHLGGVSPFAYRPHRRHDVPASDEEGSDDDNPDDDRAHHG